MSTCDVRQLLSCLLFRQLISVEHGEQVLNLRREEQLIMKASAVSIEMHSNVPEQLT
jgi:hypothetical protein